MTNPRENGSIREPEFDGQFDRFAEIARTSIVPLEFAVAYSIIRAKGAPNIAQQLLGESFSLPTRANYGLAYGLTIAAFKNFDLVRSRTAKSQIVYNERLKAHHDFLAQMTQPSLIDSDAHAAHKNIVDRASVLLEEAHISEAAAREAARHSFFTLKNLEDRLTSPPAKSRTRRKRKRGEEDLLKIRAEIEAYFADSKHSAKILILAQQ